MTTNALAALTDQPALDAIAEPLSQAVHDAYASAGEAGRRAKNAVHGVWLGHPLHPALIDVPLGAWTTALALDVAAAVTGDRRLARGADFAVGFGVVGAVGAAITGLTDWSETSGQSRRTGLVHGVMNLAATGLFAASYLLRKNGSRSVGQVCSAAGYAVATSAAYLGGSLVYDRRIGVNHADVDAPEEFTKVADVDSVAEGTMARGKAADLDVLIVRQHGRVCALAHTCTHLGGPLSEGTLKDGSVVCPWHASEFGLADGHVINGPATQPEPVLAVRERNGAIEVKGRD
jgi:nitrite reductase/ring-hydroxylating ferredoxin subunit